MNPRHVEHDLIILKNWLWLLLAFLAAVTVMNFMLCSKIGNHLNEVQRQLGTVHRMQQTLERK